MSLLPSALLVSKGVEEGRGRGGVNLKCKPRSSKISWFKASILVESDDLGPGNGNANNKGQGDDCNTNSPNIGFGEETVVW